MFVIEDNWLRVIRKSRAKALEGFNVNGQRQWKVDESSAAEGVDIPGRSIYAQNDSYLEMCNPGWKEQRDLMLGLLLLVPFALLVIWMWYGFAIHPILFKRLIMFWTSFPYDANDGDGIVLWMGWLVGFPLAAGAAFLLVGAFYYMGARTLFFTYARGRVRFNRITRKVYVLRPGYCGGNQVFDWDRLVALCDLSAGGRKSTLKVLALYHPPFDPNDQPLKGPARGEDCIFVGDALPSYEAALPLWEYIRRYMQEGPTVDDIPPNASAHYKKIALRAGRVRDLLRQAELWPVRLRDTAWFHGDHLPHAEPDDLFVAEIPERVAQRRRARRTGRSTRSDRGDSDGTRVPRLRKTQQGRRGGVSAALGHGRGTGRSTGAGPVMVHAECRGEEELMSKLDAAIGETKGA